MTRLELFRALVALPEPDGYSRSTRQLSGRDDLTLRIKMKRKRTKKQSSSRAGWVHSVFEKRGA